jgi:protein involved in polysaccharide export with SLBB domain
LKPGETLADVLRMAGGLTPVADINRLAVERLDDRNTIRITQLELPQALTGELRNGDVLRAFNSVLAVLPVERQNKRVRIEGEVLRPGEYVLPARSSINDALSVAGGLTPGAYVYGTEFSRESVRVTQQDNYERALRDLEIEFAKASTTLRSNTADEAAAQSQRSAGTTRLIERLRSIKPTGRVVLQVPPESRQLPDLALEDGDRLYVPARPSTVGVFGSVFNGGSYLWSEKRNMDDYLRLAGGPTKGADEASVFVIRANGSVVSNLQNKGWLSTRSGEFVGTTAQPGDTIFVPEEINKTTFIQGAKDWTQILYQFGLGIAGIVAATR